ncbi:MAG: DUF1963 domain-containing protein [Oscillospiraceae bacterium]|nr:DUF1963 domain-containing protein [Oscillospiraceae bacterium]
MSNTKNTKPCIKIKLTETKPSIFESKAGGLGYIPHDADFPKDSKGNQLRLLAQIDCSEVKLDEFPERGLLQFWILNDDVIGLDFDNQTNQDTFRIIYYSEVDKSVTEEEVSSKFVKNEFDNESDLPVEGEFSMEFTDIIDDIYYDDEDCEDDENDNFGHKAGGFPAFTQNDPREYMKNGNNYDFLLFQLDSDCSSEGDKVLWGDCGIGNFFINSEKLKNLDFSDVLYNWDCC